MLIEFIKQVVILFHIVVIGLFINTGKLQPYTPLNQSKSILLVTSHPDDEAMFFGPTIGYARKNEIPISVLCLSDGGSEGLGETRRYELLNAVVFMGLSPYNLTIVSAPELPDSMTVEWKIEDIISHMAPIIEQVNPTTIITFDGEGVSNHTNHIQTGKAVLEYVRTVADPPEVYALQSVPFWRKYSLNLDVIIQFFNKDRNPAIFLATTEMHFRTWIAMVKGHKSQMKWFRYGWLLVSRYIFVNDYKIYGAKSTILRQAVDAAAAVGDAAAETASQAIHGEL